MSLSDNLRYYIEERCRLWQHRVAAAHQAGYDAGQSEYGRMIAEQELNILRVELEMLTTWLTSDTARQGTVKAGPLCPAIADTPLS